MFKSLQSKMILFFSIIFLCSGLFIGYLTYTTSEKMVVDSMGAQAKSIAVTASNIVDAAKFQQIVETQQKDDYYIELQHEFYNIKTTNGLKYLYTMNRDTEGNYYYVVDGSTLDQEDEDFSDLGVVEEEVEDLTILAFETGEIQLGELDFTEGFGYTISAYQPILTTDGLVIGVIGADFDATTVALLLEDNRTRTLIIVCAGVIISILLVLVLTRLLLRPLKALVRNIRDVQNGDLTVQLEERGSTEIVELTHAFSNVTSELRDTLRKLSITQTIMKQSISTLSTNIVSTEELGNQLNRHIELADRQSLVQQQATNETNLTMSETASSMVNVTESSQQMLEATSRATLLASSGNESMSELEQQMKTIEHASLKVRHDLSALQSLSHDINEIVGLIKVIASQTGMLALNASIEAARAGEHGRGFNVVAMEVRKLADRSDEAATKVEELIGNVLALTESANEASEISSNEVTAGVTAVHMTGEMFEKISYEIVDIKAQATHLSETSSVIGDSIHNLDDLTDQAAKLSQETVAATQDIKRNVLTQNQSVQEMKGMVDQLQVQATELEQIIIRFKIQ